jgi:uncharacterized surface protein with fasciclin (FAS1) repeats
MQPKFAEKVLFVREPALPELAPVPTPVPTSNGSSASLFPREARTRDEAARLPRWQPKQNLLETAAASGRFQILGRAIRGADLAGSLSETGPFTLFAPTDEAFAKMPAADLRSLLADKARLRSLLTYHVVAGKVRAPRERVPATATAMDGRQLTMTVDGGYYRVDDAQIVKTNLRASNGVIHAIDSVLVPR